MSPALGFDCVAPSVSDGHFLFRFADHLICVFVIINSLIQSFRITDEFFYFTLLSLPSLADEFYLVRYRVFPLRRFLFLRFSHHWLLGFAGFYWVLTEFLRFATDCYRVLPSFTYFYWVLLGFHLVLLCFTGFN